uniref:HMG box domain-containing protein n=1 Tax=Petromyzon marinus TaxID=7757 RepID=S4RFQ3_PETMA
QTFHTPSLGDEEFEIPPINPLNEMDPSGLILDDSVVRYHGLEDTIPPQGGQYVPHFPPQNLDLPAITVSRGMMGGHMNGMLSLQMRPTIHFHLNVPTNTTIPMGGLGQPGSMLPPHGQLTTINQSHLGLGAIGAGGGGGGGGGGMAGLPYGSPSPPGSKSATPSPTSSANDEEADDAARNGGEKRPAPDSVLKKPKMPKKKKKKDPNEPQKPVSAYALFFRDTQAAIKGQNPSATFGEVSKIVASMWDGLGEEQKQAYKRRTEAAKKEYLKQLAAYRARKSVLNTHETIAGDRFPKNGSPTPTQATPSLHVSRRAAYRRSTCRRPSQCHNNLRAWPPSCSPSPGPSHHHHHSPHGMPTQMMTPGQAMVPPHGMPMQRLHPAQGPPMGMPTPQQQQQQHMQHAAAQQALMGQPQEPQPPHSQPQGQPQPPQPQGQHMMVFGQQPPPGPPQHHPMGGQQQQPQPQLHCEPIGPDQQSIQTTLEPRHKFVFSSPVNIVNNLENKHTLTTTPPPLACMLFIDLLSYSKPGARDDVEECEGQPPPHRSCVRAGCPNPPAPSADWDSSYCSSECVVHHCRDVFMAWVAGRNQSNAAPVK